MVALPDPVLVAVERALAWLAERQQPSGAVCEASSSPFDVWETINASLAQQVWRTRCGSYVDIERTFLFLARAEGTSGLVAHGTYLPGAVCIETSSEYVRALVQCRRRAELQLNEIEARQREHGDWAIENPEVPTELQRFPSVTAFALAALTEAGSPLKCKTAAARFLRQSQHGSGHWGEAWQYYGTPLYPMAAVLRALSMAGEIGPTAQSAKRFLTATQRQDGSWGAGKAVVSCGPAIETALALQCLYHCRESESATGVRTALRWLLNAQSSDGSWPGHFPHPVAKNRKSERPYATSQALIALGYWALRSTPASH